MRLLLDTHAFLWWVFADPRLSCRARAAIADDEENDVFVSAVSAWEITTKFRIGKLPDAGSVAHDVAAVVASKGFGESADLGYCTRNAQAILGAGARTHSTACWLHRR